jgi:hypothetical protein
MRRLLLACLLAAAPARAEAPPALLEATEAAAQVCTALGGTPAILPGYETVRDLNGDGSDDFVTDMARFECAGAWSAFCGSSGCPVSVWLSRADGPPDRFDLGRLTGFAIRDGDPLPALVAEYAAIYCGEATAGCSRTWIFASNAPEEPPIDGTAAASAENPEAEEAGPPAGAAAPAPAASGWSLRRVPGASPVALGMGVGNIASLAGFCLEGQPFLAVTFHDRPAAETVRLAFGFSQGAVEAETRYEETAGGAFVAALAEGDLAARLAGRDREVAVSVDGAREGVFSLAGSTRALRGALEGCHGF